MDAPTSQAPNAWLFTLNVAYGAEYQRGGLLFALMPHGSPRTSVHFFNHQEIIVSNKQVGKGRRSSPKMNPKCQKNYGKGDSVGYAANVALDDLYTRASHFSTRATHKQRVKTFVKYCKQQKMRDVRNIDKPFVLQFGIYVKGRLESEYKWPDGSVDKRISIAYAHNVISTVNILMRAFRGDDQLKISGREVLGVCRKGLRKREIQADVVDMQHAANLAIAAGFERGAAVMMLARAWGLRVREAILQDLDRMQREILATGEATILEGCKGGRKSKDRTIKISEFRQAALDYAIEVRPQGSKNLLSETDTVKRFLLRELNPCRPLLKDSGVPTFHELRAGFAQDIYEEILQGPSPLKQPIRDKIMDRIARDEVARQLGHGRRAVAGAYVGGTRNAA
jgi:hypothetical protein